MPAFIAELQRRNVFRVAASYVVIAWLVIQGAETLEGTFSLPDWFDTGIAALLMLGFPVALVFSWAYEITPDGVKKTADVADDLPTNHQTAKRLDLITLGALVVAIALVFVQPYLVPPTSDVAKSAASAKTTSSIAVLPFVDLSPEGDQGYFSDGISEEILNVLAKIPELHVTSRSSAFSYKGKDIVIPEVARELGVAHVLEGSVRKAGPTVRITAQLIEAETDKHLWSETYDRQLDNIFAIQDEISAAIVAALKTSMGLSSETPTETVQETSGEAYSSYLLGKHLLAKRSKSDVERAIVEFDKAIALDPGYAPAYASLAEAWYLMQSSDSTPGDMTLEASLARAEPALARALALDNGLPEAQGVSCLIKQRKGLLEEAVGDCERALAINPSLTNVRTWYSQVLEELGRYEDYFTQQRIIYERDPAAYLAVNNYAVLLRNLGRWDELEEVVARLKSLGYGGHAVSFEAGALQAQGKWRESAFTIFDGRTRYPDTLGLGEATSFMLAAFQLPEDAVAIWPRPDNPGPILRLTASPEEALRLTTARLAADPDNLEMIYSATFAHFFAKDYEGARAFAQKALERIPAQGRNTSPLFQIITAVDWLEGKPLNEADIRQWIDKSLELIEVGYIAAGNHRDLAVAYTILGEEDKAFTHFKAFYTSEFQILPRDSVLLDFTGWNQKPRYMALVNAALAEGSAIRDALLKSACEEARFPYWQPSKASCALIGTPLE